MKTLRLETGFGEKLFLRNKAKLYVLGPRATRLQRSPGNPQRNHSGSRWRRKQMASETAIPTAFRMLPITKDRLLNQYSGGNNLCGLPPSGPRLLRRGCLLHDTEQGLLGNGKRHQVKRSGADRFAPLPPIAVIR